MGRGRGGGRGLIPGPRNIFQDKKKKKKKKKKLYVGALPFILAVLGGRTFKDVIKVK